MVALSEKAAKEVERIINDQGLPGDTALRLSVQGGGCSGFSYAISFDNETKEHDSIFEHHGRKVVVDAKSHLYLAGTELDFNEDILNRGFVFNNPNAKSSCGCGHSFDV